MADICCELVWILSLFKTFGMSHRTPVNLHCNSKSAIHIAHNSVFHERTKHIEHECHIVREKLQLGMIKLLHIAFEKTAAHIYSASTC